MFSGLSLHTEVLSRSQQRKEQLSECKYGFTSTFRFHNSTVVIMKHTFFI